MCVYLLQSCLTLCDPLYRVCQAPLSMWFSRQEYWSGLPVPFSRGSSQPRDQTGVSSISCIAGRFFTAEPPSCNWTLFYLFSCSKCSSFGHWDIFNWILWPSDISPSIYFILQSTSLFFGMIRCFWLIFKISCPRSRISHLSKEFFFLLPENDIRNQHLESNTVFR